MVPTILVLLLGAGLVVAFMPRALPVDVTTAARGAMEVAVADDGMTRVREVFVVSAPLPGRVLRFEGDVGDPVTAGETVLAQIRPSDPAFLDVRTRSEQQAAVRAATAALSLAEAEVLRLEAELDFARAEHERAQRLFARGTISASARDRARMMARTGEASLMTARAGLNVRRHELETAQAALIDPSQEARAMEDGRACCFPVLAPVSGRILRIFRESEGVVEAGAPLVEIGDPADLEVVIDLLSTDAVQVSVGDAVRIERWGTGEVLNGRVRRVEPYGFTKVSALGIEEQRVNVVIDITDPAAVWERLGHGYRVDARIVLWNGADILQVPLGALFRSNGARAVFVIEGGRALQREVAIGRTGDDTVEVTDGLAEGAVVIVHPSDQVVDGVRVEARDAGG